MKLYAQATTFDEDALQSEFNRKKQNFTSQPVPPYAVGDLWAQGNNGDIMVCRTARASGSFSQSDWEKASKYTDDQALEDWMEGDYARTLTEIQEQIDSKAETWYQSARPDIGWTVDEKEKHIGDLWYNTTNHTTWRYTGSTWEQQNIPTAVFDAIDGKAAIYTGTSTPSSPEEGDLWFKSASDPILTYVGNQWVEYNKYTDDSALTAFKNGAYATFVTNTNRGISDAQTTANSRITTFYQTGSPTANTIGDLWIDTDDNNKLYRWNGSSWVSVRDAGIQAALGAAANAQDTADGKIVTFAQASQPTATDTGDLWIDTDDNNKLYRWNGSSWVSMRDGTIAEAANTAKSYIADLSGGRGVFVHENGQSADPSNGTGVWITDAISIVKNGLSYIKAWIDGTVSKVRIGLETAGHVILNASGMEVYKDANTKVAEFGSASQIGRDGESRVLIDYHSLKLVDKDTSTYFYVSDLRDETGYATIMERFRGDGSTSIFTVHATISSLVSATDSTDSSNNGTKVSGTYSDVQFGKAPDDGAIIKITYTTSEDVKAYTIGTRDHTSNVAPYSVAAGHYVDASGYASHAEGWGTEASGYASHAEGEMSTAVGPYSHAESYHTVASGHSSHSEGHGTTASGDSSHAEGYSTTASRYASHAEGDNTATSGYASHAEGERTVASGDHSHAAGYYTSAIGENSHAEGYNAVASGENSHAQNIGTIAKGKNQTAIGKYNIEDSNNTYALIIGNGQSDTNRKNITTVDWNGNVQCGDMQCGDMQCDNIKCGYITGQLIQNNSHREYTVTFDEPFPDSGPLPIVVASLVAQSTDSAYADVTVSVGTRTRSDCKIHIFNKSGSGRTPHLMWMATTSGLQ